MQTSILLLGKTAHLNSIWDTEFKICTQNISNKAATFQRKEISMYFNYGVINMQSIYFFLPSPNVVRNIVQMQLYIYLSVSIPVQGFYFVWGWVFFFLIVQCLFMSPLRQALEKKGIYLSVFINYRRINREWFLFTTDGLVL